MKTIVADFKLIYFRLNLVGSRLESLVLEVWGRWESGSLKLWVRSMLSTFEKVAFHGGGDFEGKYVLSYSTNIFQVIEDLDSTTKNIL